MDPRIAGMSNPANRRDGRSKLFKLQSGLRDGNVVNACPFGCGDDQLDDHGYCYHLIGFCTCTRDNVPNKEYEPLVRQGMQAPRDKSSIIERTDGVLSVLGGKDYRLPLEKGDILIRVTTSYRVYRKSMTPETSVITPRPRDEVSDWTDDGDEVQVRGGGEEEIEEAGDETPMTTRAKQ